MQYLSMEALATESKGALSLIVVAKLRSKAALELGSEKIEFTQIDSRS